MVSNKKLTSKKVVFTIIVAFLVLTIISFGITKIVYDSSFGRYDCYRNPLAEPLQKMVNSRTEKSYFSGKNRLSGYLYKSNAANKRDALIVIAPGHNSCADGYLWQTHALLELGWSVFAFDATGCCKSEGESAVGFSQEILDLTETLNFIENEARFGYNDIVLLGHSMGGYAVCCALKYDYDIAAAISVSGINSAMEGTIGAAASYVGPLAYGNYGMLWLYQSMLFGSEMVNLRADKIISSTDTPVLLVHGENDTVVPYKKYSIISHKEEITNNNIEYIVRRSPDNAEHNDILFDDDGTANDELMGQINQFLEKQLGEKEEN